MSSILIITTRSESAVEACEWRNAIEIELEGEKLSFSDGEPEDATISRDFSDVHNIENLILLANKLGLEGKKITVNEVKSGEV